MRMRTAGISVATAAWLLMTPHIAAAQSVVPLLKCVVRDDANNRLLAFFGYASSFQQPVTLDIGPNNFFSPGVLFRNQPTEFLPGVHLDVFSTSFQVSASLPQVTWFINSGTPNNSFAVAKDDRALDCTAGRTSLNSRGPWAAATAYGTGDVVTDLGSSWVALRASLGVEPTEGVDWSLVAGKGERGDQGAPGTPGAPGGDGVSSPLIFLLDGQPPPAGYALIGQVSDDDRRLTILICRKQ